MRLHNLFESDTPESLTEDYLDIEITEDFAIETRILEFTPEGDAIVEIDDQALELMNLDEEQLNEFIPLIIGGAALGLTAYDAYKNYKAYKNGDITGKQLAQKVGTDAAIGLATGGVVKIAGKAYKGIKNLIKGKEAGAASTVVAKGAKELAPEIEPPSIANRSVAAVATQADDGIAAVQDRVQAKATKKSDAKKKAAKRAYRASNNSGFGSGSSYSDPLQRVIGKFNFEAVNPMVPFGNTKRKSTSHKQSKISSSEYQKVKKRKDFNASDWKWDGDQDLYVRESVTEMNKYGLTAVNKEGKFYAFRHGKMVGGPFDTMQELSDFQLKSIENEDTDTAIPYTFTKKDFEDNEDANMHTENGMEIAKMFGTPQEVKRMEMIMKAHNQRGHILGDEQAERNAIVSKYYDMLEGLDEGMMSDMEKDLIDMYKGDGEPGLADAMGMSEKEFAQAYTKAGSDIQKMIKNYVNANEDINVEIPEDMYERISNYSTSLNEAVKDTLMGVEDPVIVITNAQGKIVDKLQMSIAAKKYKFNMTFIRPQFKHQGNVKHGQFTLSAPMAGQPMEGYSILPDMPAKYVARDGLEGPIMTRSGKVVYYDNVEGKYYDPDTDIYLTYDEWKAFDPELPIKSEAIDAVLAQADGYSVVKDDGGDIHIRYNDSIIGDASFDSGSDSFWVSLPGKTSEGGQESFDTAQDIIDFYAQNKITEIASPDEQATHSNVALDTLRKIVADKQNMPVKFADGQMNVDLYSASAITQVFDKINPQNQAKLLGMMGTKAGMIKVTNLVFGMMNKKGDHSVAETEGPVSEYTGNSIGVKEMEQMLVTLADKKVNSIAYQRFISGSDKYKADPALAKELEGDKKKLAADVNESVELDRIKYLSGL